jgi:hypothetical protein
MKSNLLKYIILFSMVIGLGSCKKDETQTVSNVSPAGALTASATALTLAQSSGDEQALTLSFPAATVTGYQIPVASTIQFDLKGNNFKSPRDIVVTTASYSPTVSEFNTMLLALGVKVGTPAEVEVRLRSGAAINAFTYSNVLNLTATPYLASAWIYVPGAYQGWLPASADSLVSLSSDKIYKGAILFTEGNLGFKITPAKVWDVAYGDAGGGKFSGSGGDFSAGTAGLKLLTFNFNDNTFKIEDFKIWSITGDATPKGWDGDTDLKYINGAWTATLNLTAGELKFREDHKWDNNYGAQDGKLKFNSDNIKISAAGNYTITFSPSKVIEAGVEKYEGGNYSIVKN